MKLLLPEFGLLIWTLLAFFVFLYLENSWPAIVKGRETGKRHYRFTGDCERAGEMHN
jgi:hypothetical protein